MNKEDVKNVIRHVFHFYEANNKECNWTELNEACSEVFRALDQKPDIKVPDGVTNGDMIKTIFDIPDSEIGEGLSTTYIYTSKRVLKGGSQDHLRKQITFSRDWWNAPYKGGTKMSEFPTGSESEE